jgi:hypothetical protein
LWKQGVIVEFLVPPVVPVVPTIKVAVQKIFPKEASVPNGGLQEFLSNIEIRVAGVSLHPKLAFPLLSGNPTLTRNGKDFGSRLVRDILTRHCFPFRSSELPLGETKEQEPDYRSMINGIAIPGLRIKTQNGIVHSFGRVLIEVR